MRSLSRLAVLALASSPAFAQIPRTAVEVDGGLSSSAGSAVAAAPGGLCAMLFKDAASAVDDLYLVSSADGGVTWSAAVKIDLTPGSKFLQSDSVAIVGTHAYCGWTVATGAAADPEEDLAFCIVDLAGPLPVVSSPEVLVAPSASGPAAGQIRDYELSVCRGSAGVNVAFLTNYDDGAANSFDQAWVVSAPAGGPFTPPVPLSPAAPLDCDNVALDCDGDVLAVVWDDNGPSGGAALDTLFLSVNTAAGAPAGWSAPVMVNAALTDDVEDDVDVAVSAGKVFAAWCHEIGSGPDHPFGRTFTVAGPAPIGPELPLHSAIPGGDADEIRCRLTAAGNPVAFFDYDTAGPDTIFAATSTDCGAAGFLPEVALSAAEGSFLETAVGSDGAVVATWSGFPTATGADLAETALSCDDGLTWRVFDANTSGADADFSTVAYDDAKRNVLVGFQADPGGANDSFAGGFSACTPAAFAARNAGTNPASLTVSSALIGGSLDMTVDLTTTGHSMALALGFDTSIAGVVLGGGQTLLCLDGGSGELLTGAGKIAPGPLASFTCPIPNLPCFHGTTLCVQAVHAFGVAPFALSNAVDVTAGAF